MTKHKANPIYPRKLADVTQWDMDTDVVVVGFGGSGACAAIEAADAGAKVIIFEVSSASGGSTALSSAEIYMGGNGGTRVQQACGWHDSTEAMFNYLLACAGPQADENKIRNYCEGSLDHFNWLVAQGVPFKDSEFKERAIMALTDDCLLFTGSESAWPFNEQAEPCPRGHNLKIEGDNGGPLFMKIMTENVVKRNVDVHYDARTLSLIVDEQGEVHGVVARIDMQEVNVRARKGVVLCAGGFVMNEAMVKKYAPQLARCTTQIGNPGDTGGGILMGQGVGARAINMHEGFVTIPYYPPSSLTFGIFVNAQGQRFINEDSYHGRVASHALRQLGERVFLVAGVREYGDYEKVSYMGAPVGGTGETIEELALELKLPSGQLEATLAYYNEQAKQGVDPLFNKNAKWLRTLEPPFVALDCTPGQGANWPYFTLGGLDTLPSGEVLNNNDDIIPGLYAAGRTACGVPRRGEGYSSGISVGDATFSGRMAGKAVAARPSSSK